MQLARFKEEQWHAERGTILLRLQAPVCVLEYRRPPEHPVPAPMEDAIAMYRHLLTTYPNADILLAGDSAGGGIASAMLCKLRETGLPMPSCCILISPWTDLGDDGLRYATMEHEPLDYLQLVQAMPRRSTFFSVLVIGAYFVVTNNALRKAHSQISKFL